MFHLVPKFILLAFSMNFLFLSGCDKESSDWAKEKPLRPVRYMVVDAPELTRKHEFTAVVDASRKADLSFKVSGEIVKILVNQGDDVKAGQILAQLNKTDIRLQLNEAESSFKKSQADYRRAQKLIKNKMISKADFDQLKAQFNSDKAKYESARNNLAYTTLKAPFDGVIAKKHSEKFQEVNAKQTVLTLHDINTISLKVDVPSRIMIHVQKNNIPVDIKATFDEIPGVVFPLTYKEASTQADELTKTYEVTLNMSAPTEHSILPGMTARVIAQRDLDSDDPSNHFLPVNVVLKDNQGNFVFRVKDNHNGTASIAKQKVTIGEINELGIEIFSGIKEGDKVVTAGMSKISDGMLVRFNTIGK